MKRCFVSLKIPEEIREKISKIQEMLPDFKGKKTEKENVHLTLKFLGEISDEKIEEVEKKLEEIDFSSFSVGFDEIGVFSKKHLRIVWLHLTNCDGLQKKIDEVLSEVGFEKETRFMSHVTIARVKGLKTSREEFLKKFDEVELPEMSFKAKRFSLVKSELFREGPCYEVLSSYDLR